MIHPITLEISRPALLGTGDILIVRELLSCPFYIMNE